MVHVVVYHAHVVTLASRGEAWVRRGEREGKLPSVMCVAGPLQQLLLTTSTRATHADLRERLSLTVEYATERWQGC